MSLAEVKSNIEQGKMTLLILLKYMHEDKERKLPTVFEYIALAYYLAFQSNPDYTIDVTDYGGSPLEDFITSYDQACDCKNIEILDPKEFEGEKKLAARLSNLARKTSHTTLVERSYALLDSFFNA